MRAATYQGGGVIEVVNRDEPAPGEDGAVLVVEGCGVCIADGEVVRGLGGPPHGPGTVLGHEIVGRVESVGARTPERLRKLVGRRVVVDDARPCGECVACSRGFPRNCRSPHYGHIASSGGSANWGGYAERLSLDGRTNLYPLAEEVPLGPATFAFALASGVEWLHRLAALTTDDSVAVVGNSRMGVASVAAATLLKPRRIALFGRPGGEAARHAAAHLGAEVAPAGGPGEFDVVVIVTEADAQETGFGLSLAGSMGRVVIASCSTDTIEVQPESIRKRGLLVRGGRGHTAPSLTDSIAAITEHPDWLPADYVETLGLDDTPAALATLHDPQGTPFGRHRLIVPARA